MGNGKTTDFIAKESAYQVNEALEFVFPDGRRRFIFYSFISSGEHARSGDESETITLYTSEGDIVISGSDLGKPYELLMAQKVGRFVVGQPVTIGKESWGMVREVQFRSDDR